ncbi:MAG: hypothetical protein N2378_16085 [Chloroflexaceae bacterium]|nr:hypothetical protein [Chloroflexaceae bacterium]
MQPHSRGRPSSPGRGRAPARWTKLELVLILLSVVMIAFPLYAGAMRFVFPPPAPAQESTPEAPTVDPALPPTTVPTDTPRPTDTLVPLPTDTQAPTPTDTGGPQQIVTATSIPTPPTNTPEPTSTVGTVTPTNTVGTATPTVGTATPTSTVGTATPTNTVGPGTPTTVAPTNTPAPVTGVRVFKVASVSEAAPGQQFSYSVAVVTDSTANQQVTMEDAISGELEVLSASSSSGNCNVGQTVQCTLTINDTNPATVTIQVRVRATVAAGTSIANSATAGGQSSGRVVVRVSGAPVASPTPGGPTVTPGGPTVTPGGPTVTPGGPTVTPGGPTVTPGGPTPTSPGVPPTSPPGPEQPPQPPSGEQEPEPPAATQPPPAPPAPPPPPPVVIPELPTEPPTVVLAPTSRPVVRPTAAVRPTRAPLGPTNTPAPLVPLGTSTAAPVATPGVTTDVFFRLASDWGSAYPGQQVNYTLVVRNTRPPAADGANTLRNVTVRSALPANLEVLGARADRGVDPTVSGNDVNYTLDQLQPGEGVEITIPTRIRPDVTAGTLIVVQGQLSYNGLSPAPLFSNIVSVQVVGAAQPPTAPIAQQVTPTTAPYPPPRSPTVARTVTAGPTATSAPTATPLPTIATVAPPPPPPAPLPETSAGVPLLGFMLLGGTLLTRTIRLHRARSRL